MSPDYREKLAALVDRHAAVVASGVKRASADRLIPLGRELLAAWTGEKRADVGDTGAGGDIDLPGRDWGRELGDFAGKALGYVKERPALLHGLQGAGIGAAAGGLGGLATGRPILRSALHGAVGGGMLGAGYGLAAPHVKSWLNGANEGADEDTGAGGDINPPLSSPELKEMQERSGQPSTFARVGDAVSSSAFPHFTVGAVAADAAWNNPVSRWLRNRGRSTSSFEDLNRGLATGDPKGPNVARISELAGEGKLRDMWEAANPKWKSPWRLPFADKIPGMPGSRLPGETVVAAPVPEVPKVPKGPVAPGTPEYEHYLDRWRDWSARAKAPGLAPGAIGTEPTVPSRPEVPGSAYKPGITAEELRDLAAQGRASKPFLGPGRQVGLGGAVGADLLKWWLINSQQQGEANRRLEDLRHRHALANPGAAAGATR